VSGPVLEFDKPIGILGGGQLGRMLGLAALNLGLRCRFMDQSDDAVAAHVGALHVDDFDRPQRLDDFVRGLSVASYEFENVPVALASKVAERVPLYPGVLALQTAQDRLSEKTLFRKLGIATPEFRAANSLAELREAVATIGTPCVVKTRRMGYDGKGQAVLRSIADVDTAWVSLQGESSILGGASGNGPAPLIVEAFVAFDTEVSVIAARSTTGQIVFYPLTENLHQGGILRISRSPAIHPAVTPAIEQLAMEASRATLEALEYVGVLAIEFFVCNGRLLANEMAPRVHNSGHWTMNAGITSQFENHLRAITGMPLGNTRLLPSCSAGMVNLIGASPAFEQILALPGCHLNWYGKSPRPGRKVGHVNVLEVSAAQREATLAKLVSLIAS